MFAAYNCGMVILDHGLGHSRHMVSLEAILCHLWNTSTLNHEFVLALFPLYNLSFYN